jgi:serine/threonine protein kinase
MDIKPSNICITNDGDFVVADLGSVEQFGVASQSTDAYIPSDHLRNGRRASQDTDWWMLAVTLCEKMFQFPVGNAAPPTKREVLDILSASKAVQGTGLFAILTELSES